MARYKPQDRHALLLPVVLSEQIVPGSFAFALDYLVDHELDLSELDARFKNDAVGARAYDPRVRRSARREVEPCIASASAPWSRCLPTSGITSA